MLLEQKPGTFLGRASCAWKLELVPRTPDKVSSISELGNNLDIVNTLGSKCKIVQLYHEHCT